MSVGSRYGITSFSISPRTYCSVENLGLIASSLTVSPEDVHSLAVVNWFLNYFIILYSAFKHWRQCACVHFLSAICDHKQREECDRWVVGYCC